MNLAILCLVPYVTHCSPTWAVEEREEVILQQLAMGTVSGWQVEPACFHAEFLKCTSSFICRDLLPFSESIKLSESYLLKSSGQLELCTVIWAIQR